MKALSIKLPWAWLIAKGYRDLHNQDWWTTYRGELYIHASQGFDPSNLTYILQRLKPEQRREFGQFVFPEVLKRYRASIIGRTELYDCQKFKPKLSVWAQGPFCLMFKNSVLFSTPIEFKEQYGIYEVDDEEIRAQAQQAFEKAKATAEQDSHSLR